MNQICIANCGDPLPPTDSLLQVTGYSGPPVLEGATVNFYCSSGLVLIGNTSATCMAQGQWEPDPNKLTCSKGKLHKLPTKYESCYNSINAVLKFSCSWCFITILSISCPTIPGLVVYLKSFFTFLVISVTYLLSGSS